MQLPWRGLRGSRHSYHAKKPCNPLTSTSNPKTSQNRNAKQLPNVAFWCPKEKWNPTMENHKDRKMKPDHAKPCSGPDAHSCARNGAELALWNAYKHKQEHELLTMAAQILVSLRSEKAETPARSRPEEPDFCTRRGTEPQAEAWIANDICSKSRQPQIRKDRNTTKTNPPKTAIFATEELPNVAFWCPKRRWNSTMKRSNDETVPHSLLWRAPPEAAGSADIQIYR